MNVYFYKEKNTGNVIVSKNILDDENFILLKVNDEDASLEKHVPIYEIEENKLIVKVGEILHPMIENHYIMWIALVSKNEIVIHYLKPEDDPVTEFEYKEKATIYAYCNVHGLWKSSVK